MLRSSLAVLALLVFSDSLAAQTTRASGDRVEIRSLLVRDPRPGGGGGGGGGGGVQGLPIAIDPVQAAIAAGTWTPPTAGDGWSVLDSAPDGSFQDRRLAGGYSYAEVESDVDRVMLLRAAGHTMVFVNGSPRAGDVYSHGYLALPVELRAGKNTFLFAGGRGQLRATLEPCPTSPFVLTDDSMLPDLVTDRVRTKRNSAQKFLASVVVVNPTSKPAKAVPSAALAGDSSTPQAPLELPPLSIRRLRIELPFPEGALSTPMSLEVILGGVTTSFPLRTRTAAQSLRITFDSKIDGSIQYYALVNARPDPAEARPPIASDRGEPVLNSIVLSLHGASVEATSQADAYAPKPWAHLVCPTNRRPFGFDWEDWGRLDALEVLAHAKSTLSYDPSRIYLTGHSMGGHGTWHLAANHPGLFAAAAPSAGWIAFSTYSPARATTRSTQPATSPADLAIADRRAAFRAASLPSDTFSLLPNLTSTALFILHGTDDDNVPVTQARTMAEQLKTFHKDWQLLEQPGAGHWWDDNESEPGAACVDHPRIFDLFARRRLPSPGELRELQFATANPAIHSRTDYAAILQQLVPGQVSSVNLRYDPISKRLIGTTSNVAALRLHVPLVAAGLTLDGQAITLPAEQVVDQPETTLRRTGDTWTSVDAIPKNEKSPLRAGPLKLALQNRFILVYPTRGTPEENAAAYDLARYHAETWHYRAAGTVDLLPDTDPQLTQDTDRTLVLYGNADTNALWPTLLAGSHLTVSRNAITLGKDSFSGDLSAFFCRPRPGSDRAMVVALASTSPRAARAHARVPIFASGIAFPDYTVISADSLSEGAPAIRATGFFDNTWNLK